MKACLQCPWRRSNQEKPHPLGFYTRSNLRRLWNQIRRGGKAQSCHMTDPSHPDHIEAGCKPDAVARECPGSVLLVLREIEKMVEDKGGEKEVSSEGVKAYLERHRRKGLTKSGVLYWVVQRLQFGGVPLLGGPELPEVEEDDGVGLPEWLLGDGR